MKLQIVATALKVLLRIPKGDAAGLRAKLKIFAAAPHDPHPWAKAFSGGQGHIRHGDWRAVYQIDGDALVITMLKVVNRKEVYR